MKDSRSITIALLIILLSLNYLIGAYGQSQNDTVAIDKLYAKSKSFWYTSRDSSIFYLNQVERLSDNINYVRGKGYANYGLGWHEPVLYKQFQYFIDALDLFEKAHDEAGKAIALTRIGDIYSLLGDKEKSRDYQMQALTIKKRIKDIGGIALCYISLGRDYQTQRDFKNALASYKQASFYRQKDGGKQGIAYAEVNMADVYLETKEFNLALAHSKTATKNFILTNDMRAALWSRLIEGIAQLQLNKIDSAQLALESVAYNENGITYDWTVAEAQKKLIPIYSQKGLLKKAFDTQAKYIQIRDTLEAQYHQTETQRLANEYEFKIAQEKARQQQLREERQISRRNALEYLVSAVIVLVFFVILFSGKKWLSVNLLNTFIFTGLLLLFEFLLVVTDPAVESITNGEPLLKLLSNVVLALVVLPIHNLLEKLTKRRLLSSKMFK